MKSLNLAAPSQRLRALSRRFVPANPLGEGASFVAAFGVGALLHFALKRSWRYFYGHEAPLNPSQPDVKWSEALMWGLATGAMAGMAKVVARRGTDIAQARLRG